MLFFLISKKIAMKKSIFILPNTKKLILREILNLQEELILLLSEKEEDMDHNRILFLEAEIDRRKIFLQGKMISIPVEQTEKALLGSGITLRKADGKSFTFFLDNYPGDQKKVKDLTSNLGAHLLGKKVGEYIFFKGNVYQVENILPYTQAKKILKTSVGELREKFAGATLASM